jgi:heme O synthase-like polyprenyltransferase
MTKESQMSGEQMKVANYWADWLIDAVGGATQNRALLRGDPAEDEILTQAIVLNGKKAILNAMKALAAQSAAPVGCSNSLCVYYRGLKDAAPKPGDS